MCSSRMAGREFDKVPKFLHYNDGSGSADSRNSQDGFRPSSAHFLTPGVRAMDVQKPLSSPSRRQPAVPRTMTVRPFLLKPQWMNGLSERLLVSHYVNNYGGALRRLNAI